ncbi:hypothetical protein [Aureispira anguillae]|uniref:Uncharacterized protein n=1 Tax=Aureispira anguillae TaxID=2864201 RepID=A0A916DVX7_9BACT|nr:hypothetical protein [Aureispira anguillae]BDS13526.1 hypothetical protein AsAng_0042650 [Aureispira anguillae]
MQDQFNLNTQIAKTLEREQLKEVWLEFMQQLSGDVWTDYNAHDPGITIMEQLCDTMSKINKRATTPIQNLLNSQSRKKREEINNAFYDAVEILPSNPVTQDDYRILIIDRIQYVKNAWVDPVRDNMQGIRGLYRILLQIDETARTEDGIRRIKKEVFALFNQHRNLCEDIESIQVLEVDKIEIFADIDIHSEAIAEEVLAEILFHLEEHLNPSIQFHTLEDLLEKGYSVDEAFDGPPPVHGLILKSDLRSMTQEVYVSKLIEIVQGVEGVRRITYFRVDKNGIPVDSDIIPIRQNTYPVLDMDTIDERFADNADYPLQFFRGALNYELDLNTANQLLYSLYARYKKGYQMKMLYHEKDFPSTISLKEVERYDSLQNSLPVTYGVNELGLPDYAQATRERIAMVKQLRGYLLFFEQTLSNYLSQLANVRKLFSIDKDINKTYYSNTPDTIPGIYDLISNPTVEHVSSQNKDFSLAEARAKALELFNEKVAQVTKKFDPYVDRRNRFLDHLLGRFGEQFSTDFLLKVSNYVGVGHDDDESNPEIELINAKIEFLQNYINISKNRGKGFDYLGETLDDWNVSGLEKRASLLLNIKSSGNKSVLDAFNGKDDDNDAFDALETVLDFVPKDTKEGFIRLDSLYEIHNTFGIDEEELDDDLKDELDRLRTSLKEDEETQDSEEEKDANQDPVDKDQKEDSEDTIDYTKRFVFRADSRNELIKNLMAHGILSHNYIVLPTKDKQSFSIYYKGKRKLGVFKIREVSTRLAARKEIEKLIKYLHKLNKYSEGMHVVEHILLRPQAQDQHGFVLTDDQDVIILESYEFGDIEQQRAYSDELISVGIYPENYSLRQDDQNNYVIALADNYDVFIAKHPVVFKSKTDAQDKILDIIDYIRSFKKSDVPIYDNIKFTTKQRKGNTTHSEKDFYSLTLSVVLPTWPSRFQNSDFRDLLRNIIVLNAPVYVHIDFLWLDSEAMHSFEEVYFDWLQERIAHHPRQPELDEKAQRVMDLLMHNH